jgi:hypothetical protein
MASDPGISQHEETHETEFSAVDNREHVMSSPNSFPALDTKVLTPHIDTDLGL